MKLKKIFENQLFFFLLLAFLGRIILSFFGTLTLDQNTFVAWSNILAKDGFGSFYQAWSDYLPGYLYFLWLLGKIKILLPAVPTVLLYKLPAIMADLATGYLIYKIVKTSKKQKMALLLAALYVFNPAVWANSALWGQVDSLTALFSLLAVYLAGLSPLLSAVTLALGVLIKPQAALAAPAVLFIALKNKWRVKDYCLASGLAFLVIGLLFFPFAGGQNLPLFIYQRLLVTLNQYPYTSVNAFSVWGLWGFWQKDSLLTAIIGYSLLTLFSCLLLFKARKIKGGQYLVLAGTFLAGFLFQTRMHERHLLPVLAPLLISASLIPDLYLTYLALSVTYLTNLYYSYLWITQDFKQVFSAEQIKLFIILNLFSFGLLLKKVFKPQESRLLGLIKKLISRQRVVWSEKPLVFPRVSLSQKSLRLFLGGVLVFSFLTRVGWLNKPEKEYFDEVYHAFTARLVLHADPKAWEWWNPHPEGFAYEWTHPPVAKLLMALGMKVFGENAFGWRLPGAILGAGCVWLVYLLAKYLFKDELLALLAAAVFSLDGLVLTMSRIGMNDTYFLFFTLLALYLFFKERNFWSALALGLALASKWSAVYSLPIFVVAFWLLKKQFKASLIWFLLLPPLVYLGSYYQLFLTGHSLEIFTGMQKQMWWYHTNLKATHPYTSAWWSWPFLIRPVYLYTSAEVNGWVARIYNLGNPAVFWFGLVAVVQVIINGLEKRNRKLLLLAFAYLIFFVPWALSPRIMFFYHYLPSLPFLAIAAGYVLRRNTKLALAFLVLTLALFIYFYPHWAGLQIPLWLDKSYYWFKSWR